MYNANKPTSDDLPSSGQLLKSTLIAMAVAATILMIAVLPAEYGIDPTGMGRALGLTQMGEIKNELAREAVADNETGNPAPADETTLSVVEEARAEPARISEPALKQVAVAEPADAAPPVSVRNDEVTITLTPGQGAEIKLEMLEGTKITYRWSGNGGRVNFDTHGDPYVMPKGFYHGYGKGRATLSNEGEIVAAFDGYHGWFWRNRTKDDVTLTLKVEGDYIAIKRLL